MKRMMYSAVIVMTCLGLLSGCKELPKNQPPDLNSLAGQIMSLTVYDLEGLPGLSDSKYSKRGLDNASYSKRELDNAFQASFDPEIFRELAAEAKFKDESAFWKGSSLAVATLQDGTERQLALSYYGGFFKILGEDGFFYFEGEALEAWDEVYSKAIVLNDFHPKRREQNRQQEEGEP
jgi:hypothetical protein